MGFCYEEGFNVPQDYKQAVEWYLKAAEQGDASAQRCLGICYKNGNGVTKDYAKAVEWWRMAAEQGDTDAQDDLGLAYENGEGVTKDMSMAVEWYRKAAEQDNTDAQLHLGNCYKNGNGVTKDYAKAVEWYRKAAEQEDERAYTALYWIYHEEGDMQDHAEAVKWVRKRAELGNANAQDLLGDAYKKGEGVKQDKVEAVKWYRKAAEQENESAYLNLYWIYNEEGYMQDKTEAVKWLRKRAELGDDYSQCYLGRAYANGEGVNQDYGEAVKWYHKAAEQGYVSAYKYLAKAYEKGEGVKQDMAEALKWYQKAGGAGDKSAAKKVAQIHQEHLEFMDIPLNGSITQFQTQLQNKGFRLFTQTNSSLASGSGTQRIMNALSHIKSQSNVKPKYYKGKFAGEDCYLAVFYREKDLVVYGIKLIIPKISGKVTAISMLDVFKQYAKDLYFVLNEIDSNPSGPYAVPSWKLAVSNGEIYADIFNYDFEYYYYNLEIIYLDKNNTPIDEW